MKRIFTLSLALVLLLPLLLSASAVLASPAPVLSSITAAFTATPFYVGTAEGSLKITATPANGDPANLPDAYVLAWGNADGPLADYSFFEPIPCTGEVTSYLTGEATVVPNTADRMLVYPVYDGERESTPATAYLPIEFFTYDWGSPITSFGVASDIHINENNYENYNDHFKALLADLKATLPSCSALYINGDIADYGKEVEYQMYRQFIDEAALSFPVYANYGNHDSRNPNTPDYFKQHANPFVMDEMWYTLETDDANFIFFVSSETHRLHEYLYLTEENLTWLEETLATLTANGKKTFLMFHQPLMNTVEGSFSDQITNFDQIPMGEIGYVRKVRLGAEVAADNDLSGILLSYPDVVVFSSHTHRSLASNRTLRLRDDLPYMLNTAATAYISRGDGVRYNEAQALYVDVYEDKIVVRARDVLAGKWIPEAQFALDYGMEFAGEMGPVPTPPPVDNDPPVNDPPAKGGCGGILSTATLPLSLASLGAAILLKKKKH